MYRKPHKKVGEVWIDQAGNQCAYRSDGTIHVVTINEEPSMTDQAHKDSCDLNKIINKFLRTGLMTNVRQDQPTYGDFSDKTDYHDAIARVSKANDQFLELPASIRARFNNDPGELISFLNDEKNRSEAEELGLVVSPQANREPQGDKDTPSKKSDKIENEGV